MIVYNGSSTKIEKPKIIIQEKGRDFGFGFYTTTVKKQAERWALRTARLDSLKSKSRKDAIVNIYYFDEKQTELLNTKDFTNSDLEWLEFIVHCRSNLSYNHNFDIVSGKIADDRVGETIEYVLAGVMRKEDAVERLRFEKINNQICFCTEDSLKLLSFKESYTVHSMN
ncbi:MAG: DUF3990 domain-containing protein [Treponema sp.]